MSTYIDAVMEDFHRRLDKLKNDLAQDREDGEEWAEVFLEIVELVNKPDLFRTTEKELLNSKTDAFRWSLLELINLIMMRSSVMVCYESLKAPEFSPRKSPSVNKLPFPYGFSAGLPIPSDALTVEKVESQLTIDPKVDLKHESSDSDEALVSAPLAEEVVQSPADSGMDSAPKESASDEHEAPVPPEISQLSTPDSNSFSMVKSPSCNYYSPNQTTPFSSGCPTPQTLSPKLPLEPMSLTHDLGSIEAWNTLLSHYEQEESGELQVELNPEYIEDDYLQGKITTARNTTAQENDAKAVEPDLTKSAADYHVKEILKNDWVFSRTDKTGSSFRVRPVDSLSASTIKIRYLDDYRKDVNVGIKQLFQPKYAIIFKECPPRRFKFKHNLNLNKLSPFSKNAVQTRHRCLTEKMYFTCKTPDFAMGEDDECHIKGLEFLTFSMVKDVKDVYKMESLKTEFERIPDVNINRASVLFHQMMLEYNNGKMFETNGKKEDILMQAADPIWCPDAGSSILQCCYPEDEGDQTFGEELTEYFKKKGKFGKPLQHKVMQNLIREGMIVAAPWPSGDDKTLYRGVVISVDFSDWERPTARVAHLDYFSVETKCPLKDLYLMHFERNSEGHSKKFLERPFRMFILKVGNRPEKVKELLEYIGPDTPNDYPTPVVVMISDCLLKLMRVHVGSINLPSHLLDDVDSSDLQIRAYSESKVPELTPGEDDCTTECSTSSSSDSSAEQVTTPLSMLLDDLKPFAEIAGEDSKLIGTKIFVKDTKMLLQVDRYLKNGEAEEFGDGLNMTMEDSTFFESEVHEGTPKVYKEGHIRRKTFFLFDIQHPKKHGVSKETFTEYFEPYSHFTFSPKDVKISAASTLSGAVVYSSMFPDGSGDGPGISFSDTIKCFTVELTPYFLKSKNRRMDVDCWTAMKANRLITEDSDDCDSWKEIGDFCGIPACARTFWPTTCIHSMKDFYASTQTATIVSTVKYDGEYAVPTTEVCLRIGEDVDYLRSLNQIGYQEEVDTFLYQSKVILYKREEVIRRGYIYSMDGSPEEIEIVDLDDGKSEVLKGTDILVYPANATKDTSCIRCILLVSPTEKWHSQIPTNQGGEIFTQIFGQDGEYRFEIDIAYLDDNHQVVTVGKRALDAMQDSSFTLESNYSEKILKFEELMIERFPPPKASTIEGLNESNDSKEVCEEERVESTENGGSIPVSKTDSSQVSSEMGEKVNESVMSIDSDTTKARSTDCLFTIVGPITFDDAENNIIFAAPVKDGNRQDKEIRFTDSECTRSKKLGNFAEKAHVEKRMKGLNISLKNGFVKVTFKKSKVLKGGLLHGRVKLENTERHPHDQKVWNFKQYKKLQCFLTASK